MEFAFDEDLFEATEEKQNKTQSSYNAKICDPEWFVQEQHPVDAEERIGILKYSADNSYYKKEFEDALNQYKECLEILPKTNTAQQRDCIEGMARCCLHLSNYKEALQHATNLSSISCNDDHRTVVFRLLADIHHMSGNVTGELEMLCRCLQLNPWTANFWFRIAKCYEKLFKTSTISQGDGVHDNGLQTGVTKEKHFTILKFTSCFIRARLLFKTSLSGYRSFGRVQCKNQLEQVDEILRKYEIPESFVELATKEFSQDLDSSEKDTSTSASAKASNAISPENGDAVMQFEEKWLCWIKDFLNMT